MPTTTRPTRSSLIGLVLFLFGVWTLRATFLYEHVDAQLTSPYREVLARVLQLLLWMVPCIVLARFDGEPLADAFRWHRPKHASKVALVSLAYLACVVTFEVLVRGRHLRADPPSLLSLLVVHTAVAFVEESTFRGYLLRGLEAHARRSLAHVTCALLFVTIHLPRWTYEHGLTFALARAAPLIPLSLLLGFCASKSESIGPPMLLHVANNLFVELTEI